jgi:hypothetical protein
MHKDITTYVNTVKLKVEVRMSVLIINKEQLPYLTDDRKKKCNNV